MPMKYASKAFRRREREIQRRNSKNLNPLDSDEDDNGNKLNDYEQKRLQNIVDRKNKIDELKVNFIFNTSRILQNIFANLLNCMVNILQDLNCYEMFFLSSKIIEDLCMLNVFIFRSNI